MKGYLAIFKARVGVLFQYRAAALAGLATQLFWGIMKVMILTAFYSQAVAPPPISLLQAIAFIWIGQALLQLLPWNFDKEVEAQVRNGNVAYEIIRPLNLYWFWFFRAMAMRLVPTLLRSIPIFIVAGLFFDLTSPPSWSSGVVFLISVGLSAILSSAITTLVMISFFWTLSGEGIQRLLPHVVVLLSGLIVPLPLYPDWMKPFLYIQPFRFIVDVPTRLYLGMIQPPQAFAYFGFQLLWILFFVWAGSSLLKKAMRQFVVQGG